MKRTDMAKNQAVDLMRKMKQGGVADRFGQASSHVPDRKEQRRLDQAAGLIPFAVKLKGDLVGQLQALAAERETDINTLTEELLRKGLAG